MENNRDPHKRSHSHQDEHEQDIISRETETKRANYTAKGYWTPTEDKKLKTIVMNGSTPINWNDVVRHFPNRSRKQCRERWLEYLNPDIDNSEFTPFEDQLILQFQEKLGNKWKEISEQMMEKKRTATQVKVRWHFLKRKLKREHHKLRSTLGDEALADSSSSRPLLSSEGMASVSSAAGACSPDFLPRSVFHPPHHPFMGIASAQFPVPMPAYTHTAGTAAQSFAGRDPHISRSSADICGDNIHPRQSDAQIARPNEGQNTSNQNPPEESIEKHGSSSESDGSVNSDNESNYSSIYPYMSLSSAQSTPHVPQQGPPVWPILPFWPCVQMTLPPYPHFYYPPTAPGNPPGLPDMTSSSSSVPLAPPPSHPGMYVGLPIPPPGLSTAYDNANYYPMYPSCWYPMFPPPGAVNSSYFWGRRQNMENSLGDHSGKEDLSLKRKRDSV
mmetsp:Transcript_26592/g.39513  ORF Transcript_26592/g.39513 Transcript_26592/m.39513 type:complete len:444 (+) Transcript_26592:120-1451(+)